MRAWFALLILLAGCSGSPTRPTPTPSPAPAPSPTPSPQPAPRPTVSGTITDTVTGARVGSFSQQVDRLPALLPVTLNGYVTRQAWVTGTSPTVDLIPQQGFDLTFYRQFVRGSLNGYMDPLRRVTQAPSFYVRTVDQAGAPIDTSVVNFVMTVITTSRVVEAFTGGRYAAQAVTAGPDSRDGVPGWITVRWFSQDPESIGCGRSAIGGPFIELTNHPRCGCSSTARTYPALIKHEVGHALGFWHTDSNRDLMWAQTNECDNNPSDRERHHAAIAYARSPGSRDIDQDPQGSASRLPRVVLD